MPERIRLIVLFGGQSAEHDVSCTSARHVLAAADPQRYVIEPIAITRDGDWVRADDARIALHLGAAQLPERLEASGTPAPPLPEVLADSADPVVVFPVLHGPLGEDGTVQGLLELADVPYVGSGVLASALAMDKIKAKEIFTVAGIPQARWEGVHSSELASLDIEAVVDRLGEPLFVKPANLGSSVGVAKAKDAAELALALTDAATFDEWVVVEEAIDGREIECAVLGNLDPIASVPGEIVAGAEFYDYADKYLDDSATLTIPAELPAGVTEELRSLAVEAYKALRCEGLARVDFFYEPAGRGLLVNEINTMPGFTPISMYPKMWAASGIEYPELIDRLVQLALDRHSRRKAHRRIDRG